MKGMVRCINDVRMAQLLARELGLRADSNLIDQIADRFAAFRAEREQQLAALKAEFDPRTRGTEGRAGGNKSLGGSVARAQRLAARRRLGRSALAACAILDAVWRDMKLIGWSYLDRAAN
jgi:hypothetical protein